MRKNAFVGISTVFRVLMPKKPVGLQKPYT
jgi:hypothetical protein